MLPLVLVVDDEEAILTAFVRRFGKQYRVLTASDGTVALEILRAEPGIGVVVTDIRMPNMTGLELIQRARTINRDAGFIVVSGHAEAADVILALRAGARNFLRKPYSFQELGDAVANELRNYHAILQNREERARDRAIDRLVVALDRARFRIPTDLSWVHPLSFRLSSFLENGPICGETGRQGVALALVELLMNAMEHGNMEITGEEKLALRNRGDSHYLAELKTRAGCEPFRSRHVQLTFDLGEQGASFLIEDEGPGFNAESLPNPEDAASLFAPSGRGILLARAFVDEVTYNAKGNAVRLVKRRERAPG